MNEAKASLNFYVVTPKGYNLQITLRDDDEKNLLTRYGHLTVDLEEKGCQPKAIGKQPEASTAALPGIETQAPLPITETTQPHAAEELTFDATELACTMQDGKPYWKAKGGQFSRYGVSIWPEALAASGIDPDKMDPSKTYTINMVARYTLNDKGKPHKVTLLEHR